MFEIKRFTDRDQLFSALTKYCVDVLGDSIDKAGSNGARFLVSGGGTPGPLYSQLANQNIHWSEVNVGLIDERWVPETDAGSNARLIRELLLSGHAQAAKFTPMFNGGADAKSEANIIDQHYHDLLPADLAILGMGNDGHTASLFPGAPGLESALDLNNESLVCAVYPHQSAVTGDYLERMSLTLKGLNQIEHIILLLIGSEKMDVLTKIMSGVDEDQYPVASLLRLDRNVQVFWAP